MFPLITGFLILEFDDFITRIGILSRNVIHTYVYVCIGSSSAQWISCPCNIQSFLCPRFYSSWTMYLTIGQIVVGYMCDKMPYVQVMLYSAIFSAIAAFTLLGFASSLPLIFVFVVIFGSLVKFHIVGNINHR